MIILVRETDWAMYKFIKKSLDEKIQLFVTSKGWQMQQTIYNILLVLHK